MDFFGLFRKKLNNEIQWNGPDPLESLDPVSGVRSATQKKPFSLCHFFFLKWSGLNRKDFLDVPDIYDVKLFLYLYL